MSTTTSEPIYLPGLTLEGVAWETYCQLRDNPAHDGMRMTYLDGDLTIPLAVDPPPSLVIDVHDRTDAEFALPTYARLGVPEVWLYKVSERTLWFGRLAGKGYEEIGRSRGIPRLTPTLVLDALDERSGGMGNLDWHHWLDAWAPALPEPPADDL